MAKTLEKKKAADGKKQSAEKEAAASQTTLSAGRDAALREHTDKSMKMKTRGPTFTRGEVLFPPKQVVSANEGRGTRASQRSS